MDLFQEFTNLVKALDGQGLDYRVVGALALAIHGVPRATTDIDLLVRREDVDSVLAVARTRGFAHEALPMRFRDGTEVRRVTKIEGSESLTLDLMLLNDDLVPAWESVETVETEDVRIRVVSREALLKMKVAAGRTRDLADVERLEEMDR